MTLPWNFERFREYLSHEVLLQAASVLRLFEGEEIDERNPRIQEMQAILVARTGKSTWIPDRKGSEDITLNLEGDFYRNKGRLLTSTCIMVSKDTSSTIKLTNFGKRLGDGYVGKIEFYDFIISNFKYPNSAYQDSYAIWNSRGAPFWPFIFLLKVLTALYRNDPMQAYLTAGETFDYIYPTSRHGTEELCVKNILLARKKAKSSTERSEAVKEEFRQITDILGFLCLSGHCYYKEGRTVSIGLNAISVHKGELTYFQGTRSAKSGGKTIFDDSLHRLNELIRVWDSDHS